MSFFADSPVQTNTEKSVEKTPHISLKNNSFLSISEKASIIQTQQPAFFHKIV